MTTATPPVAVRPRRATAWIVLAALMSLVLVREFRATPPAQAVYCQEATSAAQQVTMLSASWCRYCTKARNWLVAHGVSYCEWDIERSPTGAARYADSHLKVIPQIFVADRLLVGFDEHELERVLDAHDLLPSGEGDVGR